MAAASNWQLAGANDMDRKLPMGGDEADDLPRTLRRERDARAAREREMQGHTPIGGAMGASAGEAYTAAGTLYPDDFQPAVVKRLSIPFFHLMFFFLKAVIAAIPAIILLAGILFGLGTALKTYAPEWAAFQVIIAVPEHRR